MQVQGRGRRRESQADSPLPTPPTAPSMQPIIRIWAELKRRPLNQLSRPGAPVTEFTFKVVYIPKG